MEEELMDALQPGYVSGLTLLGGEPFEPEHQYVLLPFLQRVRRELPKNNLGLRWLCIRRTDRQRERNRESTL
ncbi:MAG: 4Fe-4S cluster-binding domain-containing protein [Eubacterium ramulus]